MQEAAKSKKSLTLQTWHRPVWKSNFLELRLLDGVEDNMTHWLTVHTGPHPGPPREALLVHGENDGHVPENSQSVLDEDRRSVPAVYEVLRII